MARTTRRTVRKAVEKPVDIQALLKPVESSNIASIGHHGTNMYVLYKKTNALYLFKDVPEPEYLEIVSAESVGKALIATKRKGEKIEIPEKGNTAVKRSFKDGTDSKSKKVD